jgi:hypothetical protein
MKTRDYVLVNAENITDTKTFKKALDRGMKIQEARIIYQATNGATSNTLGKLNGMVSKLEVVDGSDVLHSLSFRQEQARDYYLTGRLPFQQLSSKAAGVVIEEADIYFGRFPGDRDYYLDTSRFTNAQLSLSSALTISGTAGFATGTGYLTVILKLIEDGAPPCQGFILSKEAENYTTVGSGTKSTDLPVDYDYQSLMFGALKTTIEPDVDITNWKLSINNDSFIPFDLSATQILQGIIKQYPRAGQRLNYVNDTSVTWLSDIYGRTSAWVGPAGATGKGIVTTVTGEQVVVAMTTGDTGSAYINVRGYAPHSFLEYRFGDGVLVEDYLKVAGVNSLRLKATDSASGGAYTVVTNQLRR